MPKIIRKLTEKEVKNAPIKERPYRLYDEGGLRVLVRPSGTKVWQYPYRFNEKANTYTIGHHSSAERGGYVTMVQARKARDEVRALLQQGIDPNKHKVAQKFSSKQKSTLTFEHIAREWHSKGVWVPKHSKNIMQAMEDDVFPHIGCKRIDHVTTQDIISILSKVEERGALDVAKRIGQRCAAVFDYGLAKGICENNPASGRSKFVKTRKTKHRPHLKESELSEFLNRLDLYHGRDFIRLGMQLLVVTFVRPGELRNARWSEFEMDKALWRISADRMKMGREHIVPLSNQALEILSKLQDITGSNELLLPSVVNPAKAISDVTFIKVLRVMGYKSNELVPHGFRHTASTILNEHRFDTDFIERQLAHVEKNQVRRAYNHAEYLDERYKMMQWYADHLDCLKDKYNGEHER